jgi:hypothetical protein
VCWDILVHHTASNQSYKHIKILLSLRKNKVLKRRRKFQKYPLLVVLDKEDLWPCTSHLLYSRSNYCIQSSWEVAVYQILRSELKLFSDFSKWSAEYLLNSRVSSYSHTDMILFSLTEHFMWRLWCRCFVDHAVSILNPKWQYKLQQISARAESR